MSMQLVCLPSRTTCLGIPYELNRFFPSQTPGVLFALSGKKQFFSNRMDKASFAVSIPMTSRLTPLRPSGHDLMVNTFPCRRNDVRTKFTKNHHHQSQPSKRVALNPPKYSIRHRSSFVTIGTASARFNKTGPKSEIFHRATATRKTNSCWRPILRSCSSFPHRVRATFCLARRNAGYNRTPIYRARMKRTATVSTSASTQSY